ncbi:MAG: hypothetical protein H6825_00485 [Planctomycetes bacterium]|nr:hypothetical protein [Planctomycetota bacterium]
MSRILVRAACALLALSFTPVGAQLVLGLDGPPGLITEFSTTPGAPCGQPNPYLTACPYGPSSCLAPPPGPVPFGTILGDIADDPLTDTVYVTDGFSIGQYVGDSACGFPPPCGPLVTFLPPTVLGPLTGMCGDATGTFAPGFVLWITDGTLVCAIAPPAGCGAATIVSPPCFASTITGSPLTDLSLDPASYTLWGVESGGFAMAYTPGTCALGAFVFVTGCSVTPALTGIAFDTNTPHFAGGPPCAYVTDGMTVDYVDLLSGFPAPPTFYTPVPCMPAPATYLCGLAMVQRGITWAGPRSTATLTTFGQSCSPGPTFGLEVSGAPSVGTAWLILNFSFPGPGYFCPGIPGVGTKIYVDPTFPGSVTPLPALGPGCTMLPLPIPSGAPAGLNVFAQFVFLGTSGPPALDATGGLAFTLGPP